MTRRRLLFPLVALLCPVLLVTGLFLGAHPTTLPSFVRDAIGSDRQTALYGQALDQISDDYYRKVDKRALLDASLSGAVSSLDDRFSNYFDPKEYASFQQQTDGAFVGIGIAVREAARLQGGLTVTEVYAGSPAAKAGIEQGDTITEVAGRSLDGMTTQAATARIKGPAGTSVTLTYKRDGKATTRKVGRARVALPIASAETVREPNGTKALHATLTSFTSGAHGVLGKKIRDGLAAGDKGVVLDLRDNGGGLLDEAVLIASIFIPEGTIVTTKGRSQPRRVFTAAGNAIDPKVPVVVLVNQNSASSSEIVTGALKDRKRATVVGTRTFGKGVFQRVTQLPNGGALDITVGEYFLPSGRNLGGGGVKPGTGITPDVVAKDDPKTKRDEGLDAALKVLAKPAKG